MTASSTQSDHEAAQDALLRYALALDLGDKPLLTSAFTPDITWDPTHFSTVGLNLSSVTGRDAVVDILTAAVGTPLDTSHVLTNFRVQLDGDKANVGCYANVRHFRKGEGLSLGHQECFTTQSRYESVVVRDGDVWRVQRLVIKVMWSLGDVRVVSG